jgi:hypothetical protein
MNILELPDEILDLVILTAINDNFVQQLRVVRLICHRFAGLHSVLSTLFRNITFMGDFEQSIHLTAEALSKSNIATHVRHITFLPPLRCDFTFEAFEDVFTDQARKEYGCYHPNRLPRDRFEPVSFWRIHPRDAILHSVAELKAGHEEYSVEARKSLTYTGSDALLAQVSALLAQCTRCKSFKFGLVDYNFIGIDFQPLKPESIVNSSNRHYRMRYKFHRAGNVADTFFRQVVKAMIRAGCRPETLIFHQAITSEGSNWISSLRLDGLNSCHLKHITLKPRLPDFFQNLCSHDTLDHSIPLGPADTSAFCSRSAATLEFLELRSASLSRWYFTSPRTLPVLQHLILGPTYITPDFFTAWLGLLPRLQDLILEQVAFLAHDDVDEIQETGHIPGVMKRVFDSMRNHPSLRRGELGFDAMGTYECSFDKDAELTMDDEEVMTEAGDEDLDVEEVYSFDTWISLYIRGKIPWADALEHEFGDYDE